MVNKWLVKKRGYTFDRRIFMGVIALLVIYVGLVLVVDGVEQTAYLKCPETAFAGFCDNPMPQWCLDREKIAIELCGSACESEKPLCTQEYIKAGETVGEPPSVLYSWFLPFLAIKLSFAFIANHLLYNQGVDLWSDGSKE